MIRLFDRLSAPCLLRSSNDPEQVGLSVIRSSKNKKQHNKQDKTQHNKQNKLLSQTLLKTKPTKHLFLLNPFLINLASGLGVCGLIAFAPNLFIQHSYGKYTQPTPVLIPFSPDGRTQNNAEEPLAEASLYALMEAEFALDRGDATKALQIYKEQAFLNEATSVFERALTLSLENEEVAQSLDFVEAWQQQNPQHTPAIFYATYLALNAHEYELAVQSLNQILANDPQADLSGLLEGIYPENESDQRELLSALEMLNTQQNPSLLVIQAGLLMQFGNYELALDRVNTALAQQPKNVPYNILKADLLKTLNRSDELLTHLKKARRKIRGDDSKNLYLYEVRYRLKLEQNQQAFDVLLQAHNKFENDFETALLAALVGLDLEEYQIANELLTELTDYPIYQDRAYYYLGISAKREGQQILARQYFNQVKDGNLVLTAQEEIVASFLQEDKNQEAFDSLTRFRENYDIFAPESYIMQAEVLQAEGKKQQATSLLQEAHEEFSGNPDITFALAQTLDDNQDYFDKYILLSQLYASEEDNQQYQLAFAKLLLTHRADSEHGRHLAQQIVDIDYDDERFSSETHLQGLELLATSAYDLGDYQQVIDLLAGTYELFPSLSSGTLLLKSYTALGESEQANILLTDLQHRYAELTSHDNSLNPSNASNESRASNDNNGSNANNDVNPAFINVTITGFDTASYKE